MQKTFFVLLFLSCFVSRAQAPIITIEEDYSKPSGKMWVAKDDSNKTLVEDGLYKGKGDNYIALGFEPDPFHPQVKKECVYASDMEFTLVNTKIKKEPFVRINFDPIGDPKTPYLDFNYNKNGIWKLANRMNDVLQEGTTIVDPNSKCGQSPTS